MRQIKTQAIVLSRTNFGEADRILAVITPDNGKVRLMARGVRKIKSKLAGGVELFSISQVSFIIGKGEIRTLTSSRLERHFENIVKDVNRTMFGYEVLKLIDRITEDEAGEEYFELLKTALASLNDLSVKIEVIKLWLYARLLHLGGHSPNLKTDPSGNKLAEKQKYSFDLDNMAFTQATGGRYNANHIKFLRLAVLAEPQQLAKITIKDKELSESLKLIEIIAKQYLNIKV